MLLNCRKSWLPPAPFQYYTFVPFQGWWSSYSFFWISSFVLKLAGMAWRDQCPFFATFLHSTVVCFIWYTVKKFNTLHLNFLISWSTANAVSVNCVEDPLFNLVYVGIVPSETYYVYRITQVNIILCRDPSGPLFQKCCPQCVFITERKLMEKTWLKYWKLIYWKLKTFTALFNW